MGEGFVHFLKTEISLGLRKNWHKNAMVNMLRTKALKEMMQIFGEHGTQAQYKKQMFFKYKAVMKLVQVWNSHLPISFVELEDGSYGCVISDKSMVKLERLRFVRKRNGHCYHEWDIQYLRPVLYEEKQVVRSCLLLPELGAKGIPEAGDCFYTAINSEWNDIGDTGQFSPPNPSYATV